MSEDLRLEVSERPGVVVRSLVAADEADLRRIHKTPDVSCWWGLPDADFPRDEPDAVRLTIEIEGAVAGMIQFYEELEPRYRFASIDIFLDPAHRGVGIGTEVLRRVVQHLVVDRGHHRITIDPAAANTSAIRSYEKAGFRAVGVMRRYERDADGDGWHDGLLMELLAEDLQPLLHLRTPVREELEQVRTGQDCRRPARNPDEHGGRGP